MKYNKININIKLSAQLSYVIKLQYMGKHRDTKSLIKEINKITHDR